MIDIVYPRTEEVEMLDALIGVGAAYEAPTVNLFQNDVTPTLNSVIGDFDIPDNTEFPGYAESDPVTWGATAVNLPNGHAALLGSQQNFVASSDPPAPLLIYGYILEGTAGRYQFVRFDEPRLVQSSGDYVAVDPFLVAASMVVDPQTGA